MTGPVPLLGYPHRIRLHPSGECGECPTGTPRPDLHRPIGECNVCFEQTWAPETIGARCINAINPNLTMPCAGVFVRRTP